MENLKLETQGQDEGDEDPNYFFDPVGAGSLGWHHPQQLEQHHPDVSRAAAAEKRARPVSA
jgi:hypothetical protein